MKFLLQENLPEITEETETVSSPVTIHLLDVKNGARKLEELGFGYEGELDFKEAVENGKQVDVLVELKARFDEANNIEWSRRLEEAGCHVVYGIDGFKVHSKVCQITRKEGDEIQYITQIGTGNYNEKTSKLYTDLSLITANKEIGEEASMFFRAILLGETTSHTELCLVQ